MSAIGPVPPLAFAHLSAMTGPQGLYEHAEDRAPRTDHGSCVDDVARALGVLARAPRDGGTDRAAVAADAELDRLTDLAIDVLDRAVTPTGKAHNRLSPSGAWTDRAATGDWWGRAIAGLAAAARFAPTAQQRARALRVFLRAARIRATEVRTCAFAAIGAADVLAIDLAVDLPGATPRGAVDLRLAHATARSLLVGCLARIPRRPADGWAWPEARLRYANAVLPAALIAGGDAIGDADAVRDGLEMLDALLRIETSPAGHLSVTGSHGRAPGEAGPLWDQQPIEPAAIADACAIALAVTGDARWADGIALAWAWFMGVNDAATPMVDLADGAGYDGLEPGGRNRNCGAESTLAALSTQLHARQLVSAVA